MKQTGIERLSEDLKTLAADAEALFKTEGQDLTEKTKEIRDRLSEALEMVEGTMESVNDRILSGAKAADTAIRSRPYQALGIALAVGLLLGLILRKKK